MAESNGSKVSVKVSFDTSEVTGRILNTASSAQKQLDARVLQDSNFFCPMDSGMLQKSGITSTVIGSGAVIWATPYARRQYYEAPNKSHEKNPNACMKWFEAAKARYLETWVKIANDEFNN